MKALLSTLQASNTSSPRRALGDVGPMGLITCTPLLLLLFTVSGMSAVPINAKTLSEPTTVPTSSGSDYIASGHNRVKRELEHVRKEWGWPRGGIDVIGTGTGLHSA